jgi:hypothetical protein
MRGVAGLAAAMAMVCVASHPSGALAQSAVRAEIPIRDVVQSNRQHRYTVPITVGGVQIEAPLDSGSTGMRILPDVVPAAAEQSSGRRTRYSYGNGVFFGGTVVEADMTIGGPGGVSGRVRFQQIDKVGCIPTHPACQWTWVKPEEFGIESGGLPNEGFKAILGINMASDMAPNPLMVLGAKRWILELPRPVESKPGRLILNPTDAEVAGYTLFRIDGQFANQRGGWHDAIAGCITNNATRKSFCGPTHLDSGAVGVDISTSDPPEDWGQQTPVTMAFLDEGKPVMSADFTVGATPGSRLKFSPQPGAPGVQILLGTIPYYAFSVLYDPAARTVGLKAR